MSGRIWLAIAGVVIITVIVSVTGCGGPAHHAPAVNAASTTTAPPTTAAPTPRPWPSCSFRGGIVGKVIRDRAAQERLAAGMTSGAVPLPTSTVDRILGGAWVPPGTYSGAVNKLYADATQEHLSQAGGDLAAAVAQTAVDGQLVQLDLQNGTPFGPDWHAFTHDVAVLARDCGGHG